MYGGDGYNVIGNAVSYPSYVNVTPAGNYAWTWDNSTSDVRALQKKAGAGRIAACWYSSAAFSIDLSFNDQAAHQVALYLLDWDTHNQRMQRIEVVDTNNNLLDNRPVSSYLAGQYLVWNLSGHVIIRLYNMGNPNAAISGIFFGAPSTAPPRSGMAGFLKTDTTTQGTWKGVFGADGSNVIGDTASYPAYVAAKPSGNAPATWAASTSDIRGLQKTSSTDRVAACWYDANSFSVDLNFTDSATHEIALYLLDWDQYQGGRTQRVEILDGNGAVLDSRAVAGFTNGQYLVWNVSGHVIARITNLQAGNNGVVSGVFFK